MQTRKQWQRQAIRNRAERAIGDLYHNATITYPRSVEEKDWQTCDDFIRDAASFEIEYLRDGVAYGGNYRQTLAHSANAGKLKSEAARRYYVRKGLRSRDIELTDCGMLTGWRILEIAAGNAETISKLSAYPEARKCNAQWERIGEFGKLYQWGRGGRTLAPDELVRMRGGGSFSLIEDYFDEKPIADAIDAIRILESFNRYVSDWCASVPEMWAEESARRAADAAAENAERAEWEARDVITCD